MKYSSPCGLGVTIGSVTGKVLRIGIKNSYCRFCVSAQNNNVPILQHTCYKNWDEKVPSTLMESQSI